VGNKFDLRNDIAFTKKLQPFEKPVTMEEGENMAKDLGAAHYIEVSAKQDQGLEDALAAALEPKAARKQKITVALSSGYEATELMGNLRWVNT